MVGFIEAVAAGLILLSSKPGFDLPDSRVKAA